MLTGFPAAKGRLAMALPTFACLAFGALSRQAPLFTSNQNTKFLHGAASAHWRFLAEDWTARTADPMPVFSLLVELVFRLLPLQTFHVLFALLLALYAFALAGIAQRTAPAPAGGTAWALFAALFAALHFTTLNQRLMEGLAGQYILDASLQPATFGVFILTAILLFLDGRNIAGALSLAAATLLHPGAYTLSSLLILTVALHHNRARNAGWRAWLPALLYLLCLLPLGVSYAVAFRPASAESWRQAADILAHQRIPHHSEIERWLGLREIARLLFCAGVCLALRRSRLLFRILLALLAFAVLSTLLAHLLQDPALLLLAPWRSTVVLFPLCFTLTAYGLAALLARGLAALRTPEPATRGLCLLIVALLALHSVSRTRAAHAAREAAPANGVIRLARGQAAPGQLYLLPPRVEDLERFRLESGVPILANWKTHPYGDAEVIEWRRRIALADALYEATDDEARDRAAQRIIDGYGVTRVVLPGQARLGLPGLEEIYSDAAYRVYEVRR